MTPTSTRPPTYPQVALLLYPFLWLQLYTFLFAQRRKRLGLVAGGHRKTE